MVFNIDSPCQDWHTLVGNTPGARWRFARSDQNRPIRGDSPASKRHRSWDLCILDVLIPRSCRWAGFIPKSVADLTRLVGRQLICGTTWRVYLDYLNGLFTWHRHRLTGQLTMFTNLRQVCVWKKCPCRSNPPDISCPLPQSWLRWWRVEGPLCKGLTLRALFNKNFRNFTSWSECWHFKTRRPRQRSVGSWSQVRV